MSATKIQIIILAGGKGTRMGSEGAKVLQKLHGKPIIDYILDTVDELPNVEPVIVVGFDRESVMNYLGSKRKYAVQSRQLGTAHAVLSAQKQINAEQVIVLNGDMPFIKGASLRQLIQLHEHTKADMSMFTTIVPSFTKRFAFALGYGRIMRDQFGAIIQIKEYKDATLAERKIREVNPGIYIFRTDWLWSHIDQIGQSNAQGEYYLTDIVEVAIVEGAVIQSLPLGIKESMGVNTVDQLANAERMLE